MSRFVAIDLAGMAPPDVVERLDYETILTALKEDAIARLAAAGVDYNVGALESDPVVKVLEVAAYRELILRQRVNDATRAIMLAYAANRDLEHRGAYYGVTRRLISPATDGQPAVWESDELLRRRIQLAPEALTTAGSEGAYEFHALGVDTSIKDVGVLNPIPGHIHVLPLVDTGDGTPGNTLIERVRARLLERDIRPLTDIVTVRAPAVLPFAVVAALELASGPDPNLVVAAAKAAAEAYVASRHRIGYPVRRSGLFAALHVAGVERVELVSPAGDVVPEADGVAFASAVTVGAA